MPLERIGQPIIFYAFYTSAGLGKAGLTVTADVWEVAADGTATEIASAAAATEIGDGLYRYRLAGGSVDTRAEYIAVFKTAGACDQAHIPAVWVVGRGWLNQGADVWSYASRTLTQAAASVLAALEGSVVSVYQYTTWSFSLTGLGDISTRTRLYFTAKGNLDDPDADDATILQVEETDGLLYIGGAEAADPLMGSLVVDDAVLGNITVTVDDSVTGLPNQHGLYDVKVVTAAGTTEALTLSTFQIKSVITKAVE